MSRLNGDSYEANDARLTYARDVERHGPIQPTAAHLALLRRACWDWNECEYGAPSMDPKRPYGNSDVEDDLAEILPDLTPEQRVQAHCELPAVLTWLTREAAIEDILTEVSS